MTDNKLVVILNEKIETGKAVNTLSHAMLGFGAGAVTKDDVKLNNMKMLMAMYTKTFPRCLSLC
jgi:hypothetical protein